MEITITTTTEKEGAHITCYLLNSKRKTILKLKDNESNSCPVVSKEKYYLEWHVKGENGGIYSIDAIVIPENEGFPQFIWKREYSGSHQDIGSFDFILK
jgi:hypothetical protein